LELRFGDSYLEYKKNVSFLIPRFTAIEKRK
jgi:protein-S-isoprenylcysteine O-methyltransferase Ste14